ncbi:hypothetical protein LGL08_20650 [Clostridium estertheticum]|uniref:hypothetical protein n=1 Tax=Clostridium estertheticum TaxID=238834 RepID=UPI001CF59D3B|nr:hypothetical protein [Clostridium estertheticum]MCB2308881.1 hypothetical protein [Clostridium estertheticum]MCB2347293.1 hypothetical protein [Clostridium estertheticum]MCB2351940.1 hypothetical protein [Clostridium estertheticum]WAG48495.1 hypothetical protein LL127_23530 [Clostridium estertheticum]
MNYKLKELKEQYGAWLVAEYKESQDNGEGTVTRDYLIFTDEKNYFITGNRVETLNVGLFKSFLECSVASQLNGERKEKLLNITKKVEQIVNTSV